MFLLSQRVFENHKLITESPCTADLDNQSFDLAVGQEKYTYYSNRFFTILKAGGRMGIHKV